MADGDALRLLLGTALGAFGATVVRGFASRKGGKGSKRVDAVDFRTFEQEEAAQLNLVRFSPLLTGPWHGHGSHSGAAYLHIWL